MKNPFKRQDPFAASRYEGMVRGFRQRERKHRWWHWAVLATLILIIGVAGYGTFRYYSVQNEVREEIPEVSQPKDELEPFNALLVGSDSRGDLTEEEKLELVAGAVEGQRADTIILAHIDPSDDSVTMVQFPRDLYVPIAGRDSDKINSALETGPNNLVKTIKQLTGLEVNQYVQVNIAGFRDVVDALGGIKLCITEPIAFDPKTGIEVKPEEVGLINFDGDRALRFVRSRNFPSGDFARIQNQQKFVAAAVNKVTSRSTLTSPSRINKLLDVAGENLSIDDNTTLLGLRKLLGRLRSFDPERYEAYVAPHLGIGNVNGASVVLPNRDAMKVLFDAIEANESPAEADGVPSIEPSTIRVGVYNGTLIEGAAERAAGALVAATDTGPMGRGPVTIEETANAPRSNYKETLIVYNRTKPETQTMAELVAAAIPDAEIRRGQTDEDVDVSVIVAKRKLATKKIVQLLPIELPKPSEPPAAICR